VEEKAGTRDEKKKIPLPPPFVKGERGGFSFSDA
jgi:hypothetical protein